MSFITIYEGTNPPIRELVTAESGVDEVWERVVKPAASTKPLVVVAERDDAPVTLLSYQHPTRFLSMDAFTELGLLLFVLGEVKAGMQLRAKSAALLLQNTTVAPFVEKLVEHLNSETGTISREEWETQKKAFED